MLLGGNLSVLSSLNGTPLDDEAVYSLALVDLPAGVAERAVFSPHLGGITGGSFRRAHQNMWNSVKLILEGQRPNFIVNGL